MDVAGRPAAAGAMQRLWDNLHGWAEVQGEAESPLEADVRRRLKDEKVADVVSKLEGALGVHDRVTRRRPRVERELARRFESGEFDEESKTEDEDDNELCPGERLEMLDVEKKAVAAAVVRYVKKKYALQRDPVEAPKATAAATHSSKIDFRSKPEANNGKNAERQLQRRPRRFSMETPRRHSLFRKLRRLLRT